LQEQRTENGNADDGHAHVDGDAHDVPCRFLRLLSQTPGVEGAFFRVAALNGKLRTEREAVRFPHFFVQKGRRTI